MQSLRLAIVLLAACCGCNAALAQAADAYPSRTITMVVPVAPGTGADIIARTVAQKLSERLKQPVVVENKVGASGVIGADAVAKAQPNGYTLMLMLNNFTMVPSIYKSLPYDPVADFASISRIVTSGYAFVVNPSAVPAKDLAEFLAQMKANPGKFSYATPGNGTAHHLAMELFKQQLGLDILHVPHKGFGDAINSVMGGHVQMMFAPTSAVLSQANSGKLRMLAVTGTQRSSIAPGIPTYRELGYDFMDDVDGWYALVAPAKTPAPIIAKLHQELKSIMALPEIKDGLAKQGLTAMSSTPQELDATIRSDLQRWAQLIKQAKIAAD
jgi:tripartite-type tricarboxylate transporter receptor subunit TctC